MKNTISHYPNIFPKKKDWPIINLSKDRKNFIQEVTENVYDKFKDHPDLKGLIELVIHKEITRAKTNRWKADPPNEILFWKDLRHQMIAADKQKVPHEVRIRILRVILERYVNEIAANFNKSTFFFAHKFVTFGFTKLLSSTGIHGIFSFLNKRLRIYRQLNVYGEIDLLRTLAKKGTIVMIPTHFSNLDSLLMGWIIQFLGLPPFIYGAGLNLFNVKILSYLMNGLGAYKVDRRKKNSLYINTLKSYSRIAIKRNCHSLFFPGGTRSRSGGIEKTLKYGLLQSVIEAQREMYQENRFDKIFFVPAVINCHFTLEAPALIKGYLIKKGRERYYSDLDEFSTSYKIFTFLFKFFSKKTSISVSIGKAMDILGNYVDEEGNSFTKNQVKVNPRGYFVKDGVVTYDKQREREYVRVLGKRIIEEFHIYNRVMASHLVAFAAFKILQKNNPDLDLFSLLRLPKEDLTIDYEYFKGHVEVLIDRIKELYKKGKLQIANHMSLELEEIIKIGLNNLGLYHDKRPLIRKKDLIIIQNTHTLYYYHNRMGGYELDKYIR